MAHFIKKKNFNFKGVTSITFVNQQDLGLKQRNIVMFEKLCVLTHVQLFVTQWTVAYQAPPSMGFPSKNTRVDCDFLQEIFPTQGLNPSLPHCRQTLYRLSHQGSPDLLNHCMFYRT